jgi:hypothetical protein
MKISFLRFSMLFVVLAGLSLVSGLACLAQGNAAGQPENTHGFKVLEIHPKPIAAPFSLDAHTGRGPELEFRAPEQMTEADRNLALANESEIARRAGLQGFGLAHATPGAGEGGWGYEQAVCPVFPEHLILEYSRSNGAGDVTLFSAVIPRGEGHVRVIPVRRRGYSLFTPASSNSLTLNDFNHLVKEGHDGLNPDWLTLGLCYAALAGGHVRAALQPQVASEEVYPLFLPAKLTVSGKGGALVQFADVTPHTKAMEWSLTFAQSGWLLKVQHQVATEVLERSLREVTAEKSVPVKGTAVDLSKPGN